MGVAGAMLSAAPAVAHAQTADSAAQARDSTAVVRAIGTPGGMWDDELRTAQLVGRAPTAGWLLRSPSSLDPGGGPTLSLVAPEMRAAWNSDLPFPTNDGAMWAGRGGSARAIVGARIAYGPVTVIAAPELVWSENREFQTIPYPADQEPSRDPLQPPWYAPPSSIDLPMRPGTDDVSRITPGQSSLTLALGPAEIGAATENLWWGPGIRNAIVLGGAAPGFPHAFVRTARPLETAAGTFDARWILGRLSESEHFDTIARNDHRSINAVALTYSPAAEPELTLGFARAVVALRPDGRVSPGSALDAVRGVPRPPADSLLDIESIGETRRDQVTSLFGRWIFPDAGFEAYAEWARFAQPKSLTALLTKPFDTQGYALGLQWARPLALAGEPLVRVQAEATYLEPSGPGDEDVAVSSYASATVPHGYTHEGHVLGAAIGPGASSQWVAVDLLPAAWRVGLFGGRIRWDNAAFYRQPPPGPNILQHDVSLFGGLRAGGWVAGVHLLAEATTGNRFNYLYQNYSPELGNTDFAIDVRNTTLRLEARWEGW